MNPFMYSNSINVILSNQSQWGSYIASPAFPTYHFCWLRDGSFIAHAMDTVGEYASAAAFFRWIGRTVCKYGSKIDSARQKIAAGQPIGKDDMLHTRFSLDGCEVNVDSTWGNFQIDGYGTWLWALAEHVRLSGDTALPGELNEAIQITLRYLELGWKLPNYDCWEEHPEYLHPYSLASVYAGFCAAASLARTGLLAADAAHLDQSAADVKEFILRYGIHDGRLVKHIHPATAGEEARPVLQSGVDASLIALAYPYQLLPFDDERMQATLQAIEADLHRPGGGVHRFRADVYYGGGEWPLLAAWLGWQRARSGEIEKARELRAWIEAQVDKDGNLPEQVSGRALAPAHYQPWVEKWGVIACPLLWSHAMYLILEHAIREGERK